MNYDAIIIGGGAAGLMTACLASELGAKILLIEKNEKLGRKIRITGKGRCNVCNNCTPTTLIENIPNGGKFMYSAVYSFTPEDTMEFFERIGVPLKTERGNRVFPVSDNANDVANALENYAKNCGVDIIKDNATGILQDENGDIFGVKTQKNMYRSQKVVVATGGYSYRATGSTGDGYKFAKKLGHTVTELRPSLVALESEDEFCGAMQGLALKNTTVRLKKGDKVVFEDFGEFLFTHFGVSGPTVLSASAHMKNETGYKLSLDLKSALSFEDLDKRLVRDFEANSNKNFENYLPSLLPKKLIPVIIEVSGIDKDTKCHSITREERHRVINLLKDFEIKIKGFRPINEAIITSGGVNLKEINPKTMQSKIINGLYFAGEVIDADAYTGGFNLQIAYSTANLVAKNISESLY